MNRVHQQHCAGVSSPSTINSHENRPETIALYLDEVESHKRPSSLYIHVPFCFHKCHYCDFYSVVTEAEQHEAFCGRLISEMEAMSRFASPEIETVFVGGGTPTLLGVDLWEQLLSAIHRCFGMGSTSLEWTVEANPETVDRRLLDTLVHGGVNRISLGAQSFQPRHLKTLERWHDPDHLVKAVEEARRVGVGQISLDLIFGIPGQTVDEWAADLETAIDLNPDHLSCYALTYEPGTPLYNKQERGLVTCLDEDVEIEMFLWTRKRLGEVGYVPYEISNFARPGAECRHNLVYWRNGNWLALGPSAAGHVDGQRWKNIPNLHSYLNSDGFAPIEECESPDAPRQFGETIMMGLRLMEGLDSDEICRMADRIGVLDSLSEAIALEIDSGRLCLSNGRLRLTDGDGLLLADDVIGALMMGCAG